MRKTDRSIQQDCWLFQADTKLESRKKTGIFGEESLCCSTRCCRKSRGCKKQLSLIIRGKSPAPSSFQGATFAAVTAITVIWYAIRMQFSPFQRKSCLHFLGSGGMCWKACASPGGSQRFTDTASSHYARQ